MANRPKPRRDPRENAPLVDRLARERSGFLRAVARRCGVEPQAIDDVIQAALLDVLRSFPGPYEPDERVAAYAARCVQSEAWKLHRRHSRKESRHVIPADDESRTPEDVGYVDPDALDPSEIAITAEAIAEERALLRALPRDQRAVLVLLAAGLSHEEISERLEISMRGVRKRVGRAHRRLRELREGAQ